MQIKMADRNLEITADEAGNVRVNGVLGAVVEKVKERAIAAARGGIVIADVHQPDMPIVYVNKGFLDITGYTPEDILGRNCRFLQGVDTDPQVVTQIREAVQSGGEFRGTIKNYRKDGTPFWNELSISPVYDEEEKLTHFVGVMLDVTSRTELEDALHLRVRAVEAANNGIIITDARLLDCPIIYANKAFERMTGYSEAEVLGRNCRFLQGVDTDPEARMMIRKALQKGTNVRVTIKNYRKDGTPFWNELTISPVRDARGKLTHYIGVQSDITDLRRTVEENARLLAEVQKAAAQQRVFLRDILASVTEGRLCLDDSADDLPAHLPLATEPIPLTRQSLRELRRIVMNVAIERKFEDERWDMVSGYC